MEKSFTSGLTAECWWTESCMEKINGKKKLKGTINRKVSRDRKTRMP